MPHCHSVLHFTSHQQKGCVLPSPLIPHLERAAAVELPQGCFHEGVSREGLACRYEQTVITDGSSVATVLPRPRCSLPPGWRPWPINLKLCHLFSTFWVQKGGQWRLVYRLFRSGTHLSLDLFHLYVCGDWKQASTSRESGIREVGDKSSRV